MNEQKTFMVDAGTPERLDVYLTEALETVSRAKVKSWCKEGLVLVDGHVRKGSSLVSGGACIEVTLPDEKARDTIVPENIPLDVIFEDEAISVINKAAGMVVHPGAGVHSGTLVHALAYRFDRLAERGGALRPGIVHRLDKGTSGIILVAKTDEAHLALTRQWQEGEVTKVYQALAWGIPAPPTGEVTSHIGRHPRYRHMMAPEVANGRFAHTRYKTVETYPEACRLNVHILTGRTHQVGRHARSPHASRRALAIPAPYDRRAPHLQTGAAPRVYRLCPIPRPLASLRWNNRGPIAVLIMSVSKPRHFGFPLVSHDLT